MSFVPADVIDPQIRRFVEEIARAYQQHPDVGGASPDEARQIAEVVRHPWRCGGPVMAEIHSYQIPTPQGDVGIRIYRPNVESLLPALIYLHGGGWTIFSLDTHDRIMREYAARAGIAAIGVDYALSPEAKFPLAQQQTVAVLNHLAAEGHRYGIDAARLAIGGDSAGANLALTATLALRRAEQSNVVRGLLLNYGVYEKSISAEAERQFGGPNFMLNAAEMQSFWTNYLPGTVDASDPLVQPMLADLAGLPPALLVFGECDILAEQNHKMAHRLIVAGVPTTVKSYNGATHSFLEAISIADVSDRAFDDSALWLREIL